MKMENGVSFLILLKKILDYDGLYSEKNVPNKTSINWEWMYGEFAIL